MDTKGNREEPDLPCHGCIVGGEERFTGDVRTVRFPFTGEPFARVHQATQRDLEDAVESAARGFSETRELSSAERYRILVDLAGMVRQESENLARVLVMEGGKTITFARAEVQRVIETLRVSAEEARRIGGEVIPLDWTPGNEKRFGITRRMPLGVVVGIVPFNFPLNLACHKLGPAVASGNAIVLKPASATPVSAILLGKMLLSAGFPAPAFSVVPCPGNRAERLVGDDRVSFVSFTGSAGVGWTLRERACKKRVSLELGGSAPVIVHEDADVAYAASRIVQGGFSNAGQVCISVQRVLLHEAVYDQACREICRGAESLVTGDPRREETTVGPLISREAVEKALAMVREAQAKGAKVVTGGHAEGTLMVPTVVTGVTPGMRLFQEEVFAPVVALCPYRDFGEAISLANATPWGLQMGLFTRDINLILEAFSGGEFGGIQVNDVPTFRVDHMPYSGEKASGLGREGPRYAIEEMTVLRLLAFNPKGGIR
ncbi:MAG: aldehyde dehydrogenase family protein [Methanolinea sp.]|nr:aldehyde dehydrogenase family protein [Methanolinea sp.]